ncbi:phosphatidylserine/phosphatidylglycerophosphate/cardiolipin synthase family protein [uncultured Friedmanniella sp.]|uniref:phospholipase D-like domain-containing protein n=1 Tax=uncultured Friedmanniella sp. TaxID=335381 RepID=UPI0035CAA49B
MPLLLSAVVALAVPLPLAPTAVAAKVVPQATTPTFSIKPGLTFNNPTGNKAARLRIVTQVEKAIDHAPKGSTIRIANYLFDLRDPATKLIKAYRRGVHVQLLIDDNPMSKQTIRVRKELGTNKKKLSYVTRCSHGCMSSQPGVMHAKFYLFSQSGVTKNVAMISSANLYHGNSGISWNNQHTIVGDMVIYNALNTYFQQMIRDKDQPNYFRSVKSGNTTLWFYPQVATAGSSKVVPLAALRAVSCKGAAKGYGDKDGRTVVRVEQWGWSVKRLDIAKQLVKLQGQGCNVQVILNNFKTGTSIRRALLQSTKHGKVKVYNAGIDTNGNGKHDKYMHHKAILINGVWAGNKKSKVVYTGSANFTGLATATNNELIMRVKSVSVYNAYAVNFTYIRDKWTHRDRTMPYLNRAADAKLEAELNSETDSD